MRGVVNEGFYCNIKTSTALKSSGTTRAQKRNKTKLLIIFKSRGHTGVISLRGRRLFKVEKAILKRYVFRFLPKEAKRFTRF